MRPRIRAIKPEIGSDEDLWDLGLETGLPVYQAFTLLWCCADREGRFEWRPRALKAVCLPYWDGDFSRVLDALTTRGFLVRYTSPTREGRVYGLVRTFAKHQHINGREPASELPCPEECEVIQTLGASLSRDSRVADVMPTRASRDDPFPSLPDPDPDPDPGRGAGGTGGSVSRGSESDEQETAPERPQPTSRGVAATRVPTQTRNRATAPSTARREASSTVTSDAPWLQRPPSSLDEALSWPLRERSKSCLQFSHAADWSCPQQWPEVRAVEERFSETLRRTRVPLGAPSRDSGVRAVLGLFADGVELDPLLEAIGRAGTDEWFRQGRKGLSSLTLEVYRRLVSGPAKPERVETAAEMLERLKAEGRAANAGAGR